MAELPRFALPKILDAPTSWGPPDSENLSDFKDIPYAPFSKFDKIGKAADWAGEQAKEGNDQRGRQRGRQNRDQTFQTYGSNSSSAFAYQQAEEDASFLLVDNRSAAAKKASLYKATGQKQKFTRGADKGGRRGMQRLGNSSAPAKSGNRFNQNQGGNFRKRFGYNDYKRMQGTRFASIEVAKDWVLSQDLDFVRLNKLSFAVPEATDYGIYGSLPTFNPRAERVASIKNPSVLTKKTQVRYDVTASEDPILNQISNENKATVFVTDVVLSALMASTRSVYPWEIIINRVGDKLFLDKRSGGSLDFFTVNENAAEPPMESAEKDNNINSASLLAVEAVDVNSRILSQLINSEDQIEGENPNPFNDNDNDAEAEGVEDNGCYKYRLFNLNAKILDDNQVVIDTKDDENCIMAVRTQLDAVLDKNIDKPIMIRALNQFDTRAIGAGGALDWNTKLDSQRGAVIATELKNNAAKLGKWAFQATLADINTLKLGFVTRASVKNSQNHNLLGVANFKPTELIRQMGLNINKSWGIVKAIVDLCMKLEEGKYIMARDPAKPVIKLYSIPSSTTFDDNDAEDDA
ncbi:Eukaryotic translation initiation factor 3 subunit D [Smittium culicis]|uniref:Eukaryotic translation initiation factor 3 subunit D n=1 Tax=Smittium culicis TaxID=133412 RepID=A0A1R1XMR6_9FUNG|nr:Eukaryotic translation initiation factor 3 subunit D [Smittium culicis]